MRFGLPDARSKESCERLEGGLAPEQLNRIEAVAQVLQLRNDRLRYLEPLKNSCSPEEWLIVQRLRSGAPKVNASMSAAWYQYALRQRARGIPAVGLVFTQRPNIYIVISRPRQQRRAQHRRERLALGPADLSSSCQPVGRQSVRRPRQNQCLAEALGSSPLVDPEAHENMIARPRVVAKFTAFLSFRLCLADTLKDFSGGRLWIRQNVSLPQM